MDYNTTLNDLANFSQSENEMWNKIKNRCARNNAKKFKINPIEFSKVLSNRSSRLIGNIEIILN